MLGFTWFYTFYSTYDGYIYMIVKTLGLGERNIVIVGLLIYQNNSFLAGLKVQFRAFVIQFPTYVPPLRVALYNMGFRVILIISLWVISGGISQAPPLAVEDDSNLKVTPPTDAQEERDIPSGYAPKLASDPMFAPGANNALKNIPGTFSILLDPNHI